MTKLSGELKDALLADMLGDLGKLNDELTDLRCFVSETVKEIESVIASPVQTLTGLSETLSRESGHFAIVIQQCMRQTARLSITGSQKVVREAVFEALSSQARKTLKTLDEAVLSLVQTSQRAEQSWSRTVQQLQKRFFLTMVLVSLGSGSVCGAITAAVLLLGGRA